MTVLKTLSILFLLILSISCFSQKPDRNLLVEKNKDVLILTLLIQEELRRTKGREITLQELIALDTTKRISDNFDKIEFESRGGYISVRYKLSENRALSYELNEKACPKPSGEKAALKSIKWKSKDLKGEYDGEIQFDYGEDHYRVKKIIVDVNELK